ncbi:probable inactive shikimate kinase like 1, chloroplastic [Typha latifolia]|uniref:probable inactive shikimate kinase like 1, chloroplastic n=1 Tax=Typha latifolia TaxID=4733 RepID=UPI003C2F65B1
MAIRVVSLNNPHYLCSSPLSASYPHQSLLLASPKFYHLSSPRRSIPSLSTQRRRTARAHGFSGSKMSLAELEPSLVVKKKAAEISSELKGTSIFLVGLNCNMKTKMGNLLADALRYYYFDSDSVVEEAIGGEAAAKSFRESDEMGFRDSEIEVLKQLSSMGRLVVCAGDGAVHSSTSLALLRHGITIWIDIPLESIANEALPPPSVSHSDSFSEVSDKLNKRYNELKGGYGTADATISLQKVASELGYENLESVTPEDMVVEVLKEIEKLTRVKKLMEAAARPF